MNSQGWSDTAEAFSFPEVFSFKTAIGISAVCQQYGSVWKPVRLLAPSTSLLIGNIIVESVSELDRPRWRTLGPLKTSVI